MMKVHTTGVGDCTDCEGTTWIWLHLDDDSLGVDGVGCANVSGGTVGQGTPLCW